MGDTRRLIYAMMAVLFGTVLSVAPAQAGNPCRLKPARIMEEIRYPHRDELTVIVAHRGIHAIVGSNEYSDTPENSRQALDNADKECFEAVELDVRLTSDNVPVLTHDTRWGREALTPDPSTRNCCYDPWKNANYNPAVAEHSFGETKNWLLRNFKTFQPGPWAETPPSVDEILNHYKSKGMGFVIFFDVKDTRALLYTWNAVVNAGLYDRVVFKMGADTFPTPDSFARTMQTHLVCNCGTPDTNWIKFMPVYQTANIAPNNSFGSTGGENKLLESAKAWQIWNNNHPGEQFVVGAEFNLKESGGILASPLIQWTQKGINYSSATFNAVGEYYQSGDNTPRFYISDGRCCATLSQYYFNGAPYGLPSDRSDQRFSYDFLKSHVEGGYLSLITSDDPKSLNKMLSLINRRNTAKYFIN
jgi:hypothetical protein